MNRLLGTAAAAAVAMGAGGCSFLNSAMGSSESSAGNAVGNALGQRAAASMVGSPPAGQAYGGGSAGAGMGAGSAMDPQFSMMITQVMFTYAFSNGGMALNESTYKPGEYTRWEIPDREDKVTIERAHLFDDAKGRQWWKIKYITKDGAFTLEALLDPTTRRIVRERGQFPKDAGPQEMAVPENATYLQAQKLSAESVEGATVGTENVTVPAGSFRARHVVFGQMGSGTHEWWLDAKVPGGAVKQAIRGATQGGKQEGMEMTLVAYGHDAKSELGSK